MSTAFEAYEEMKNFLEFSDGDVAALKALRPLFAEHGPSITDRFYDVLAKNEKMAAMIEGRVEALKKTHKTWMLELFDGDYGQGYFEQRAKIGQVHVRINLPPQFVEGVMSFIRTEGTLVIDAHVDNPEPAKRALMKILDLDLVVINMAYADERIDRITKLTGMRRRLIENIIKASN